jgi:hypothetical protein
MIAGMLPTIHVGVDVVHFRVMSSGIANHSQKILRPLKGSARRLVAEQLQRCSVTEYRYCELANNAAAYSVATYSNAKSDFLCEQRNSKDSYDDLLTEKNKKPLYV